MRREKNKSGLKIMKYVFIAFFLFLMVNNVEALECYYYRESYNDEERISSRIDDSKSLKITYNGNQICSGTIKKDVFNDARYCMQLDKTVTSCPKFILGGYAAVVFSGSFDSGGLSAKKGVDTTVESDKYLTYHDGETYKELLDIKSKIPSVSSQYYRVYYLENSYVNTMASQLKTLENTTATLDNKLFWQLDPGNVTLSQNQDNSGCPLANESATSSSLSSKIDTYYQPRLDKLKSITNTIKDFQNSVINDKEVITPIAFDGGKTLFELVNGDKDLSKYPKGFRTAELVEKYKNIVSEGGTVSKNIKSITSCYETYSKQLYKNAKDSDLKKKLKKLTNDVETIKKNIKSKEKTETSATKKTANSQNKDNDRDGEVTCKSILGPEITNWLKNAYIFIEIAGVALVVVLGMLDFSKALASSDDSSFKKAGGKFLKRLIAAVVIFLLPILINFTVSIFGVELFPTNPVCWEVDE